MEHPTDLRNISTDQKGVGTAETAFAPCTRNGTKLRDMLMSDKPNLSYANFRGDMMKNPDAALPESVGSQQSQVIDKRTPKEDEIIRYMSNLPSFLEKGKNFQAKALNVGVLDWRRLEKWHSEKQMPLQHSGHSPFSSNTSLVSTDGSPTHSSKGQSCSPAHQGLHRLSPQSPMEAYHMERCVEDAKSSSRRSLNCSPACQRMQPPVLQSHPHRIYAGRGISEEIEVFEGNSRKFQDSTVTTSNNLSGQHRIFVAVPPCEWKQADLKSVLEMGNQPNFDKYEVAAAWKGKTKIQGKESAKETRRSLKTKLNAADRDCSGRDQRSMPRDPSEHSCTGSNVTPDFTVNDRLSVERGQKSISGRFNSEGLPHSEDDSNSHWEKTEPFSQNPEGVKSSSQASNNNILHSPSRNSAKGVKGPSQASHVLSFPARMLNSASRNLSTEKKPVAGIRRATAVKPSEDLDGGKSSEFSAKSRNPLPIRRLSSAMGKMIKNTGSRENSPLRRSSSKGYVAESGSEGAIASVSIDTACSEKSSTNTNRSSSSPLRRLLDPLFKPRASNSSEPSKKRTSSVVGTANSCKESLEFCLRDSEKVNSRSASGGKVNVSDIHRSAENGSSSLQALLQVSFKNGLPLFTFAIDKKSNILAATVRKSSVPGKGNHSWTYTFFTIREVKRRSGIWLNQGGKGNGHGYIPNVVAQMKVSDSPGCSFNKHEGADYHITREFGLFAADLGHGDQYVTDIHPTNELAAIVVKLPRITSGNHCKDGQSSFNWLDFSQACLRENLQETRSNDDTEDNLRYQHSLVSTTVILPGGFHTVPSKGEISTLAQRWRSSGSCDCGGWDLGCQLRVYTNQIEYERKISSSGIHLNKFQLFSQVGQDNQIVLSLAPFKERIYSVEFNPSIQLLQAFAICISFIDCRRPPELSEPSNVVEKVANDVGVFEVPMQTKTSNQVEAPARYVSYPPHSPVGRV